jgi:hypothetical protein
VLVGSISGRYLFSVSGETMATVWPVRLAVMPTTTRSTNSHALENLPRSRLYGHMRDYLRSRPGHSAAPKSIVAGIQEQDARFVLSDLLAEWDILFYPAAGSTHLNVRGDVLARRTVRRARHSRTEVVDSDTHPVILLATDVPHREIDEIWRRVLHSVDLSGTLTDVLIEADTPRQQA